MARPVTGPRPTRRGHRSRPRRRPERRRYVSDPCISTPASLSQALLLKYERALLNTAGERAAPASRVTSARRAISQLPPGPRSPPAALIPAAERLACTASSAARPHMLTDSPISASYPPDKRYPIPLSSAVG